jgi:outer membrane lipoprotein SlyB
MKIRTAITAAVLVLAPGLAFAQSTTARGAANGAASGGAVAGPVGAAVGGTVGAAVGAAVEIPNAVLNSVRSEPGPSVVVREEVAVGRTLPQHVQLRPIQRYPEYRYAIVNDRHVIVEPRTRRVIKIVE